MAKRSQRGRKTANTKSRRKASRAHVSAQASRIDALERELADVQRQLRQRTDDLTESLEQQTATSEVLRVISTSRSELTPVFRSILANAVRLCGSNYGAFWLREGDLFRAAAFHGDLPHAYTDAAQWRVGTLFEPSADLPIARAVKTGKPFQHADIRAAQTYRKRHPLAVSAVEVAGILAILAVPMA